MLGKVRKKRVPQLKFTLIRDIGWHVSYRDPKTGTPRKHRFGAANREQADGLYHEWVARYLRGELPEKTEAKRRRKPTLKTEDSDSDPKRVAAIVVEGSLLHVASQPPTLRGVSCPGRQCTPSPGEHHPEPLPTAQAVLKGIPPIPQFSARKRRCGADAAWGSLNARC